MREYTAKEIKLLEANPYTFKVTKHKLYFTAEFKEAFWTGYQAGEAPRKLLSDFGYDLDFFEQKQIDSLAQRIRKQGESGEGFRQGEDHGKRAGHGRGKAGQEKTGRIDYGNPQVVARLDAEVRYLRQEVEFLKKSQNRTTRGNGGDHGQRV